MEQTENGYIEPASFLFFHVPALWKVGREYWCWFASFHF